MSNKKLSNQHCKPCHGEVPALSASQITELVAGIDPQWAVSEAGDALVRRFIFKGFAKAAYLANLCAWLADKEGHHPDIAFGWGYCEVTLTTHDLGGLSENDFIWAARLDALLE
ncbi:4a-hydroxytetrahydrobiopterin dehydratase [Granulosicoccus sp. 3-233]|uniref:4a-hydroxytetrahydrobiopterin dehydratase n=1 Tax=Granulosicoccus sp. 3-233 TaxID=3417969 RepID=UPI003D3491AF